jgi:hypothetical protein
MPHPHMTEAHRRAQRSRALFLFWREENERGFPLARVLVDVRIVLQIGIRFL